MGHEYLIERILKDARAESRSIISNAKKIADGNIEYAKAHSQEIIADAKKTAKARREREKEILQSTVEIQNKLLLINERAKILDDVFNSAFDKIKFDWRVEKYPKYEVRFTRESLMSELRQEIEPEVCKILFGGKNV